MASHLLAVVALARGTFFERLAEFAAADLAQLTAFWTDQQRACEKDAENCGKGFIFQIPAFVFHRALGATRAVDV